MSFKSSVSLETNERHHLSTSLNIDDLPQEIFLQILKILSPKDIAAVSLVSKRWHILSLDDSLYVHFLKKLSIKPNQKMSAREELKSYGTAPLENNLITKYFLEPLGRIKYNSLPIIDTYKHRKSIYLGKVADDPWGGSTEYMKITNLQVMSDPIMKGIHEKNPFLAFRLRDNNRGKLMILTIAVSQFIDSHENYKKKKVLTATMGDKHLAEDSHDGPILTFKEYEYIRRLIKNEPCGIMIEGTESDTRQFPEGQSRIEIDYPKEHIL